MRWSYALAALCFALLATFRLDDEQPLWAGLMTAAALAYLYLAVRPLLPRQLGGRPQPARDAAVKTSAHRLPSQSEIRHDLDVHRTRARAWLRTVFLGWALALFGLLTFPPSGLLVAAMSLYATSQYRRHRRSGELLAGALSPSDDG